MGENQTVIKREDPSDMPFPVLSAMPDIHPEKKGREEGKKMMVQTQNT